MSNLVPCCHCCSLQHWEPLERSLKEMQRSSCTIKTFLIQFVRIGWNMAVYEMFFLLYKRERKINSTLSILPVTISMPCSPQAMDR